MIRKLLKYYIIKVIVKLKELKRIYELNNNSEIDNDFVIKVILDNKKI